MKIALYIFFIALFVFIAPATSHALNWTPESIVSYVRTYDGVSYSIGLQNATCEGTKDYFYVTGMSDNKGFAAIALTSLTSGKNVRISYALDGEGVMCIVDGIWIIQ